VAKAEALGPTPLEVLLESMHVARAEGERAEAVECAKAAAPYVHPKLAPTSPPTPVEFKADYSVLTESELDQLETLLSKALKQPLPDETPPAQSRVMRGRYPRFGTASARGYVFTENLIRSTASAPVRPPVFPNRDGTIVIC